MSIATSDVEQDEETFDGFGSAASSPTKSHQPDNGEGEDTVADLSDVGESALSRKQATLSFKTKSVDPGSRIATLGKSIRLPGAGRPPPPGGIAMPGMGDGGKARPVSTVIEPMDKYRPDYEESWDEKEEREAKERAAAGVKPQEKLARMLAASNASRGISIGPGMGLAGIMGGKKQVPATTMVAPYSEHKPNSNNASSTANLVPIRLPGMAETASSTAESNENKTSKTQQPEIAKKIVAKDKSGLKLIGFGSGGVEEMQSHLDEETVQWALLRFQIGSGTFKRNKMLEVHFNGQNCPGPRRAKLNRSTQTVEKAFGHIAMKLDLTEREEASLPNILDLTKKTFTADAHMEFSIDDMQAEYEKMIAESRRKAIEAMIAGDDETAKRKTAKELGVEAGKALELVRKPMGAFNWALFHPDPADFRLFDAGSLGVNEMLKLLPEDDVLCGLIRMGFGAGKWRRTKYISIWWAGSKMGAHAKGAALGGGKAHTMRRLNPSIGPMEAQQKDELSLEEIIDKVRRAAVIDGDDVDGIGGARDTGSDPFSMEAYYAALEEEVKESATYFGEKSDSKEGERSFGVAHTIRQVREEGGKYTWVLVEADP